MNLELLNNIQGKPVEILKFELTSSNFQLILSLDILCNGTTLSAYFYNTTQIKIEEVSFPFDVQGFEIIDNKQNGWNQMARYKINDFEDGKMSFYCEDYDLIIK